jgi:hypothetical protein
MVDITFVDCFAYFPGDPEREHRSAQPVQCGSHTPVLAAFRAHLARTSRAPVQDKILVFRGRRTFRSSTPDSLAPGAKAIVLHAHIAADFDAAAARLQRDRDYILSRPSDPAFETAPVLDVAPVVEPHVECTPPTVALSVQSKSRGASRVSVAINEPLVQSVVAALGSIPTGAVLRFDGDRIAPSDTPQSLGLEDDDMLELVY